MQTVCLTVSVQNSFTMSIQTQQIHRRKSSKDSEEIHNATIPVPASPTGTPNVEVTVPDPNDLPSVTISQPPPPSRNRTHSTPLQSHLGHNRTPSSPNALPPSAGPYRTSFGALPPPPGQVNGHGRGHSITSPYRSTFSGTMGPPSQLNGHPHAHSRTRSISTPFSPASPSPLSSSFPPSSMSMGMSTSPPTPSHLSPSQSAPETLQSALEGGQPQSPPPTGVASAAAKPSRRHGHSRIHSRNLSVFFPRPESLSHRTISEDGDPDSEGQELIIPARQDEEAPSSFIPSAGPNVSLPGSAGSRRYASSPTPITPLGQGFTFGAKPPPGSGEGLISAPRLGSSNSLPGTSSTSTSKKRGHHHKHSLSHNFFSFLEPGANGAPNGGGGKEEELHTQPTPTPVSPWVPDSAAPSQTSFNLASTSSSSPTHLNGHATSSPSPSSYSPLPNPQISPAAFMAAVGQFVLGAWLWVTGQQVGSLACTGLGYWVVFDSFGVALVGVVPGWLASGGGGTREKIRRPYGWVDDSLFPFHEGH